MIHACLYIHNVKGDINQEVPLNNTLTLGYLLPWVKGWFIGPLVGSAIILGIDEVHKRQLLPGYNINWVMKDTFCEGKEAMQVAVDVWQSEDNLAGFIGPACSAASQPVSLLASALHKPVISFASTSSLLSDKETYPTFSRLEATWNGLAPVYDALADILGWTRIGLITTSEDVFRGTAVIIKEKMENNNKEVLFQVVRTTMDGNVINHAAMQELRDTMVSMMKQVMYNESVSLFEHSCLYTMSILRKQPGLLLYEVILF